MLSKKYIIIGDDILLITQQVFDSLKRFILQAFIYMMQMLHLLFAIENDSIVFIFNVYLLHLALLHYLFQLLHLQLLYIFMP